MPFDGNSYGKVALIAPIDYHPQAPSTPGVVSKCLAGANMYSRTCSAKRIGDQTYKIFSRDERVYGTQGWVSSVDPQSIARFTRWIPGHATHICARAELHIAGKSGLSTAHLRIVAADGGGTDTGSSFDLGVDLANSEAFGTRGQFGISLTSIEAELPLSNVTRDEQVTVTVQAYVTDDADIKARNFGVAYVVAWWECRETTGGPGGGGGGGGGPP